MKRKKVSKDDILLMRIPRGLLKFQWDRVHESSRARVRQLAESLPLEVGKGCSLLLVGSKGVGKSSVGALLAVMARSRRRTVLFTRFRDWCDSRPHSTDFSASMSIRERAREVDFLVIDDVRANPLRDSAFLMEIFTDLVSTRTDEGKVTVVICEPTRSHPVYAWATGDMARCIGLKLEGGNQHKQDSEMLAKRLLDSDG